tara:strand:+ start:380 stop:574 length:195 start_codon:yes stop_codon:yes gene_type:complete
MSCDNICDNCHYKEIQKSDDLGHCYMFMNEPDGQCNQFKFSNKLPEWSQSQEDLIRLIGINITG